MRHATRVATRRVTFYQLPTFLLGRTVPIRLAGGPNKGQTPPLVSGEVYIFYTLNSLPICTGAFPCLIKGETSSRFEHHSTRTSQATERGTWQAFRLSAGLSLVIGKRILVYERCQLYQPNLSEIRVFLRPEGDYFSGFLRIFAIRENWWFGHHRTCAFFNRSFVTTVPGTRNLTHSKES